MELISSEDEAGEAKGPISKLSILKENERSELSIYIDEKYASSSHTVSVEPYIFRVDVLLRKENKRAYEPEMLAIGPYHRNKVHLKMMERQKPCYIQEFLRRRNEWSLGRYVEAMEELEEKARNCYADPVQLTKNEFVEMMLVDGIFLMEILRNYMSSESRKTDILKSGRIQNILVRDILLFENQLPLFVLIHLLGVANESNFLVEDAFWSCIKRRTRLLLRSDFISSPRGVDLHHLLGVIHYAMRPSFLDHLRDKYHDTFGLKLRRCARELQEAGIKFKIGRLSKSLMDIGFENGIIEIPPFFINDGTELLLRNLIAYEQYNDEKKWTYLTSYVKFMKCLIKSSNDVKILRQRGIFEIGKGMDDESTFSMFNKLRGVAIVPKYKFCYTEICDQIEKHCERRWNRWMAKWRHCRGIWMTKLKQD